MKGVVLLCLLYLSCLMFLTPLYAQSVFLNIKFQHQVADFNPDTKERAWPADLDRVTEELEFELHENKPSTILLAQHLGLASLSMQKKVDGYDVGISIYDYAGTELKTASFKIHITNLSDLEEIEFSSGINDFVWDFQNKSSRAVLILGGKNSRPLQTSYDKNLAWLKALLEQDPSVTVKNFAFDESGMLVRIIAANDYAQALATLFSGISLLPNYREFQYALTRKVYDANNKLVNPRPYPSTQEEELSLFLEAFKNNHGLAHAYLKNDQLVLETTPTLIVINDDSYSVEKVFEAFLYGGELQQLLTEVPLSRKIRVDTQKG